jgi:MarR family transcriptional regulator, lower aerobic nicotinate degradation pathway regulator
MPSPTPVSPLESHLGYQLRIVSNAVSQAFARTVEEEGVTVAEWVLMRVLYDFESLAPTPLAERMGMTKGAITKLASRLVEKGLVKREANSEDKRAQTLSLASRGRSLVPRLAKIADENDAAFFDLLTASDRGNLGRILGRIVELRGLKDVPTD